MTFSADTRAALVTFIGASTLLAPLVLGLSVAAMAIGIGVGVLAIGLGLSGTAAEGRGVLPLSALASYDQGLALGLVFCAGVFIVTAQPLAVAVFAVAAIAQAVVTLSTRYTHARRVSQNFL
ncbi:MAG TPA: hypothetical protein VFD31_07040 [Thermoleophilaceae bacterium]|nr:hypothetical protein [Thermoleophilaceae bacterium]